MTPSEREIAGENAFALNQPEPPPRDSFWTSHWSYSRFAQYAREATTVGEIVNLAT
ncbi:hypothetical protein [Rhizobium leguminosarum]|uniref:hypothetical protein n=1 Tax=Rhizobium leguminosarum TaxID=384 RepID=UPI002F953DA6